LPYGYLEDNGVSARNGKNFIIGELSVWLSHIPNDGNIIVYMPDRWSRNTLKGLQELDNLVLKKNITIHFVNNDIKYNKTTSSAHKAMIQTELMTAEKQSNDTSEKIKGTLNRLKAEGNVIGKAPYGFSNTLVNGIRKRIVNTEEHNTIQKIKDKYLDIVNNYINYQNEYRFYHKIDIIRFIIRWCIRSCIKNRNGSVFTELQIKNIINPKQK
jgi:DNA invertase Pin-like site-specific DNA recombinase